MKKKLITKSELKKACTFDKPGSYRLIVTGIDWGGSFYNPDGELVGYTSSVTVGLNEDGKFDILEFIKSAGCDIEGISETIVRHHIAQGGQATASSFGRGVAEGYLLEKLGPQAKHHHTVMYTARDNVVFDRTIRNLNVPRNYALRRAISALKVGSVRAPGWELSESYLKDFLNAYETPTGIRQATGTSIGFLHALAFALLRADTILHGLPDSP